jgi:hypothetical protein
MNNKRLLKKKKNISLILLLVSFIIGSLLVMLFKVQSLYLSILLPYLLPTAYAYSLVRKSKNRIFIFAFVSTMFLSVSFEALATIFNFWETTGFDSKIFNLVNVENLLFFFLHQILILSVYEVFIDRDNSKKMPKRFILLVLGNIVFALSVYILIVFMPEFPLNYLVFGSVVILIPMIIELIYRPRLIMKIILVACIWIIPILINEMTVVIRELVLYHGEYVFMVHFLLFEIPFEEFFFWILLSAPAIALGYEIFMDDGK